MTGNDSDPISRPIPNLPEGDLGQKDNLRHLWVNDQLDVQLRYIILLLL